MAKAAKPSKPTGRQIASIRRPIMDQNPSLTDAELAGKINETMKEAGYSYECTQEKIAHWREKDKNPTQKKSKERGRGADEQMYTAQDIKAVSELANRIGGEKLRSLLDLLGK